MEPVFEKKKNRRKLSFLVVVVGFIFVPLELALGFYEVALYQTLVCSIFLLFSILFEVAAWTDRHWTQKYGRTVSYPESRLIVGAIVIPFWLLFEWLLGLIASWLSYVAVLSLSAAMVIALNLSVFVYRFIAKKREPKMENAVAQEVYEPARKRKQFHQASVRTVVLLSPVMILSGILLFYVGWFTSLLSTENGLLEAQTGAFGLILILLGVLVPIARILQERFRRLKRAKRATERVRKG